jgi:hypothetical protein
MGETGDVSQTAGAPGVSSSFACVVPRMESLTISLTMVAGVCFIWLGRWLYRNPRKLLPGWGFLNPEHPGVQKLAKAYATFSIFFGLFASAGVALAFLLRRVPGMPLLVFAAAVVGAWFLRPKVPQSEAPVVASIEHPDKPRLLGKHSKRNLTIFAGFMALLIVVVFVIIAIPSSAKWRSQQRRPAQS